MADNQSFDTAFVKKLVCTTSDQAEDMLIVRKEVTITADADCFINFDKEVTAVGRFLIKANTPVTFDIDFSQFHYLAAEACNLYIVAAR